MAASQSQLDDEGLGGDVALDLDDTGVSALDIEDGEEVLNASVPALAAAWVREKNAPDVLPFEEELVTGLSELVKSQQAVVDKKRDDARSDATLVQLYQRDIDRVSFMLAAYMRTRIQKIRRDALHLLSDQDLMYTRLSPHEQAFAKGVAKLMDEHLTSTALAHLPAMYNKVAGDKDITAGPSLRRHVFVSFTADVPGLKVGAGADSTSMDAVVGDCLVMEYAAAKTLVAEGKATLV